MSVILKKYQSKEVLEGAGVKVNRMFGYYEVPDFDPFLMLDYFVTSNREPSPGFPWHPHKGIETITYMLRGKVEHEDSIGNHGVIGADQVQWMTAGRGIYHQEMPQALDGGYQGFQLWLNMPAKHKLDAPQYHDLAPDQLNMINMDGVQVRLIAGEFWDQQGPIGETERQVTLMHMDIPKGKSIWLNRDIGMNGFIFVFEGTGQLGDDVIEARNVYTLAEGAVNITALDDLSLIFGQGKPIEEPVAWRGPLVMNTREEIQQAFDDLHNGTFTK